MVLTSMLRSIVLANNCSLWPHFSSTISFYKSGKEEETLEEEYNVGRPTSLQYQAREVTCSLGTET